MANGGWWRGWWLVAGGWWPDFIAKGPIRHRKADFVAEGPISPLSAYLELPCEGLVLYFTETVGLRMMGSSFNLLDFQNFTQGSDDTEEFFSTI